MQPLFRDVTDHVRRVQEEIDSLREVLAFAFEASLMTGQAQQTAHHPPARRLGRHPRRADRGRRHLRHEFRVHARAALALRLFRRARLRRRDLRHALLAIPPARLAADRLRGVASLPSVTRPETKPARA